MSKINVDQELSELITRFKRLKKAIAEEGDGLSPIQRAAAQAAEMVRGKTLSKERVEELSKALAEKQRAQKLANTLQAKGILSPFGGMVPKQPTDAEQQAWLKQQGFATEEMVKSQEQGWGNAMNDWFAQVSRPINSRFKTPEEEREYWDSIKVTDTPDRGPGY